MNLNYVSRSLHCRIVAGISRTYKQTSILLSLFCKWAVKPCINHIYVYLNCIGLDKAVIIYPLVAVKHLCKNELLLRDYESEIKCR